MPTMNYNPEMPSDGYDISDLRTLQQNNFLPQFINDRGMRFDSAEDASLFFARELDYVKTKSYDKLYPEFSALRHFPITHEVPEGAPHFSYATYDLTGMAKIISDYANDLPRADAKGEETSGDVYSLGASYGYSVQEMRASRYANKSLDVRKANAARRAIDNKANTIAFAGDKDHKIMGMLSTDNNIPLYTLSNASTKTAWADKSAEEILNDINGMFKYQAKITKDVERADTLMLPASVYIDISTRQIPNTGFTVKKFLLDNAPYLKEIVSAPELESDSSLTNPYSSEGKAVALLYTNSEEKFSLEIPMSYIQYPLQNRNLEIVVPCEERVAGIILYYPLSALVAVGV